MTRSKPARSDDFASYRLAITAWHADYSKNAHVDALCDSLSLSVRVDPLEAVKGLVPGRLSIYTGSDAQAGYLSHTRQKELSGGIWVSEAGMLGLLTLLAAKSPVTLELRGRPFYRGKASLWGVEWYTQGHWDHE